MRVNDRMIDGKKSLFVEEIQSDWHQQGRKKGYQTQEGKERKSEIRIELHGLQSELSKLRAQKNVVSVQEEPQINARLEEVDKKITDLRYELGSIGDVPDAPYKKNWQEMAMRRAIQMAVDGGYDRVAFTTGVQQVKRYEKQLRQAVDEINFNRRDENTVSISANKGGRETFSGIVKDGKFTEGPAEAIGKTVEEVLGKGIAKQIADQEIMKPKSIRDKDLTIGGEGMKGFYDKILPEYVNKYGKKYGIKVGKTKIETDFRQNLSDDELLVGLDKLGYTYDDFKKLKIDDRSKLYEKVSREVYPNTANEVHYFDITPEAKKSLLEKGSPLFAIPPAVEMTDEESRKEMLERLFKENQK